MQHIYSPFLWVSRVVYECYLFNTSDSWMHGSHIFVIYTVVIAIIWYYLNLYSINQSMPLLLFRRFFSVKILLINVQIIHCWNMTERDITYTIVIFIYVWNTSSVADLRGSFGGFSPPPSKKSSTYINIRFSRLFNVTIWLLMEWFRSVWWQ